MLGVTVPIDGKCTVYMATNRVNGKRYIGITKRYFSKRRGDHIAQANGGSGLYFHKAIRKYGEGAFNFETLARLDDYEAAKNMEIWLIDQMDPEYNCTKGGDGYLGYVPTKKAIEKIRQANLGRKGYWEGKKLLPHVIERMRTGYNNMPADSRIKMLEALARGRANSKSVCKKREVICVNDGKPYQSVQAAADAYGLDASQVSGVCGNAKRYSANGLVFRYANDPCTLTADEVLEQAKKGRHSYKGPHYTKAVMCNLTGEIFLTVAEAAKHFGTYSNMITNICRGRCKKEGISVSYVEKGT